jgi:hypothetical protein
MGGSLAETAQQAHGDQNYQYRAESDTRAAARSPTPMAPVASSATENQKQNKNE